MIGLTMVVRRLSTETRRKQLSGSMTALNQLSAHDIRAFGRIPPWKWLSTSTEQTATTATSSSSDTGTSSNSVNSTSLAIAAVAAVSLALAAGAATGVFSVSGTKEPVEKAVLPTETTKTDKSPSSPSTVKSNKINDENKTGKDKSSVSLPSHSFVQEPDFWEIRVRELQKKRQEQLERAAPVWKDGLVYDDPSQDEPSACELCNTFRHGPCRPYQRAVEYCLKEQEAKAHTTNNTTTNNNSTADGKNPVPPTEACQAQLNRLFQECLIPHSGFYRLVDNYLYQQKIDPHEWNERTRDLATNTDAATSQPMDLTTLKQVETQLVDRAVWMQHVHVNWNNWKAYVQERGWSDADQLQDKLQQQKNVLLHHAQDQLGISFGPSWWKDRPISRMNIMDQVLDACRDADFSPLASQPTQPQKSQSSSTATPYWQYLQDDPDPTLVSLTATCPLVDHKTGFPLLAAYVRDEATGRLLGHVTAPPPTAKSNQAQVRTESSETNNLHSDTVKMEEPTKQQQLTFHIIPGWTESIRVCAVYQESDEVASNNSNDDLGIVFRESPRMSLVDALSPDYQLLEHNPQRLADRFRLIRNYLEWSSPDPSHKE